MTEVLQEFDVFKMPHSRMMQLVNSCNKNLNVTDFANNDALFALLDNLQGIFCEFKSHEDIENEHIMTKLKSKLKAMAIYNSAVCNCHSNDEFTPLLDLVDKGYLFINKAIATSERITFGVKLRRALNQFTRKFVPHMKEEKEIFQPLLQKYFTQEELAEMKNVVIKLHLQKRKSGAGANAEAPPKPLTVGSEETPSWHNVNQLPNELILKVFSYVSNKDMIRAAQVCKKWENLVYDRSNWRELKFSEWKKSKNMSGANSYQFKDFDYIDESDEDEFDNESEIKLQDIRMLQYWIKYLLPRIGPHLKKLDLSYCKSLNNNLARRILQLCPNLVELNLSYTFIGENSFRGVRLDQLKSLNCEGCNNLSDNAFKFLLLSTILTKSQTSSEKSQQCIKNEKILCELVPQSRSQIIGDDAEKSHLPTVNCSDCANFNNIEELYLLTNKATSDLASSSARGSADQVDLNSLVSINLSGCWSITDYGLSYIASKYDLSNLQYLNLSGCINLTAFGIELFLEFSKALNGENLYYCDNIVDGPMRLTANGCENLECANKFCCRTMSQ